MVNKKSGDGGIDGWTDDRKKIPVQIKNNPKIGTPIIRDFVGACKSKGHKSGIIIGWDFSNPCYKLRAELNAIDGIRIELKKAETIVKPINSIEKKQWEKLYNQRVKEAKRWSPAA